MANNSVLSRRKVLVPKLKDSPESFLTLLKAGVAHLSAAAAMLKRLVDRDPSVLERIREIDPTIAPSVLSKLLLVAEGQLMPELLLNRAPAFKALQGMPVAVQRETLARGHIEVVESPVATPRRVPLVEVQPKLIPQVFSKTGVRDVEAQRAYLQTPARAAAPRAEAGPSWVIQAGKCVILRPCVLTKRDIETILRALS